MNRTLKILALVIALTVCTILTILGFAIWVFIPLLPAGILFVIALSTIRGRTAKPPEAAKPSDTKDLKAA